MKFPPEKETAAPEMFPPAANTRKTGSGALRARARNRSSEFETSAHKPVRASNRYKRGGIGPIPVPAWSAQMFGSCAEVPSRKNAAATEAARVGTAAKNSMRSIRQAEARCPPAGMCRTANALRLPPLLFQLVLVKFSPNTTQNGTNLIKQTILICRLFANPCVSYAEASLPGANQSGSRHGACMRNLRSSLCHSVASALLTSICLTAICVATICTATLSFAEAPDRIAGAINSSKMVPLPSQIQHRAKPQYDLGRVEPSFQLNNVKLGIVASPSQVKALKQLLQEQQDPKSPNFHKWLTPQQYADRFGLSHNDVQKTTAWLKSQGLTVGNVANGRNWINFSGTASQIESAFRTEIHRYDVNGEKHFANSTPPSIPAALSGIANGFLGLDDFRPKPMIKKAVPRARTARPGYYDANTPQTDFLAPNDVATIYDLGPLYTAGIDGTGEKLLIAGQTDVYLADLVNFRSGFGLPAIYSGCTATSGVLTSCTTSSTANFQYILDPNSSDPGVSTGDLSEADLDLEWSAATARGTQIIFYNSTNVFDSLLDAIDNATVLAPVISISYGNCEWNLGGAVLTTTGPGILETGMMEANTLGITILNSSGDSGS